MAIAGCPRRPPRGVAVWAEEGRTAVGRGRFHCRRQADVGSGAQRAVHTHAGVRRWAREWWEAGEKPTRPRQAVFGQKPSEKLCTSQLATLAGSTTLHQGMVVAPQWPPGLASVADTPVAPQQSLGPPLLTSSIRKGAEYSMIPVPCLLIPVVRALPQKDRKPET